MFGRPYVTSPGVPFERVAALRKAFLSSLHDENLRQEAEKSKLDLAPLSGEDFEQLIGNLFSVDKGLVERAKTALGR
jgi:tripartite-type tricarboxylate transporter receptor subunit TctC